MPFSLMIVDNDQVNSFVLKNIIIRNYSDAKVEMFLNGREGLEYLESLDTKEQEFPGVILLDIFMPGFSGFDFLDFYTQKFGHKKTSLFAMSNAISKNDQQKANNYEVVKGFITKPLIYNNIQFIVETYLEDQEKMNR